MIMAAGLGTRMRPLTNDRPKPLVEVRGKALIDHAIDRLVAAGVTLIVINTHYKAQMLTDHLAARKDVEIRISPETDEILGTGGGILKALPHFEGEPFFVHNSDSVWVEGLGHALERMKERWDADGMDALLLMASMVTSLGFEGRGDFNMDGDGHLTRVPPLRLSPYAFPGVQIVHPRLFDRAPGRSFSMNVLWDLAIEQQRLYGIRLDGVWMHVGTPDAVREADEFLDDLVLV
jgi:MurNAc alpha-1-phosphate uridylyltransferase